MSAYDLFTEALKQASNPKNPPSVPCDSPTRNSPLQEQGLEPLSRDDRTRASISSSVNQAPFPPPNSPDYIADREPCGIWQGYGSAQATANYSSSHTRLANSYDTAPPRGGAAPNYRDAYEASQQKSKSHAPNSSTFFGRPTQNDQKYAGEPYQSKPSDIDDLFSDVDETEKRKPTPSYSPELGAPQAESLQHRTSNIGDREMSSERGLGQFHISDTYNLEHCVAENNELLHRKYDVGHAIISPLSDDQYHHDSEVRTGDVEFHTIPIENGDGSQYWMTGGRPVSPNQQASPTETQPEAEGFEFHNQLPEEVQIDKFGDKAFRKALREVKPELPRKQQWYAWAKVQQMLEASPKKEVERLPLPRWGPGYHRPSVENEVIELRGATDEVESHFSAMEVESHCGCDGGTAKCRCAGGKCTCTACPVDSGEDVRQSVEEAVDPALTANTSYGVGWHPDMALALTDVWCAHEEAVSPSCYTSNLESNTVYGSSTNDHGEADLHPDQEIAHLKTDPKCAQPTKAQQDPSAHVGEQMHQYRSPMFEETYKKQEKTADLSDDYSKEQPKAGLGEQPYGWLITKIAEEGSGLKASASDFKREPTKRSSPLPPNVQSSTTAWQNNTEAASSPIGPPPRPSTLDPVARPDTPRPIDPVVRQSVELETPQHLLYRESTPGYEARSPTPSPTSHASVDMDIEMSDAPPIPAIPHAQLYSRSSPDPISSPMHTITAPETPMAPSSAAGPPSRARSRSPAKIPAPATSSPIKPAKRADKSRRKSAVQGAKVEKAGAKSRNITEKLTSSVRKVTAKVKKGIAQPVKKDSKVAEAVAKIEESVRKGSDGTPTRRSARIRKQKGV